MPRKEFTAFTRLDASDVNTYLMDQSIQTYAGTATRSSAITTPVEGMYTHLQDTDRLEFWNGSAWRSPGGMTLLNTTSFTAQTQVDITNVFSSEFDNYRVVISANITTIATVNLRVRPLAGGTAPTTLFLSAQQNFNLGNGNVQTTNLATTGWLVGWIPQSPDGSVMSFDLTKPFLTANTALAGNFTGTATNAYAAFGFFGGTLGDTTSYNGLRLFITSSTMTGTVRIYGYRNA